MFLLTIVIFRPFLPALGPCCTGRPRDSSPPTSRYDPACWCLFEATFGYANVFKTRKNIPHTARVLHGIYRNVSSLQKLIAITVFC
jgi:hypothetical protein